MLDSTKPEEFWSIKSIARYYLFPMFESYCQRRTNLTRTIWLRVNCWLPYMLKLIDVSLRNYSFYENSCQAYIPKVMSPNPITAIKNHLFRRFQVAGLGHLSPLRGRIWNTNVVATRVSASHGLFSWPTAGDTDIFKVTFSIAKQNLKKWLIEKNIRNKDVCIKNNCNLMVCKQLRKCKNVENQMFFIYLRKMPGFFGRTWHLNSTELSGMDTWPIATI